MLFLAGQGGKRTRNNQRLIEARALAGKGSVRVQSPAVGQIGCAANKLPTPDLSSSCQFTVYPKRQPCWMEGASLRGSRRRRRDRAVGCVEAPLKRHPNRDTPGLCSTSTTIRFQRGLQQPPLAAARACGRANVTSPEAQQEGGGNAHRRSSQGSFDLTRGTARCSRSHERQGKQRWFIPAAAASRFPCQPSPRADDQGLLLSVLWSPAAWIPEPTCLSLTPLPLSLWLSLSWVCSTPHHCLPSC